MQQTIKLLVKCSWQSGKSYFGHLVLNNVDLVLEDYEKEIPIHEKTI